MSLQPLQFRRKEYRRCAGITCRVNATTAPCVDITTELKVSSSSHDHKFFQFLPPFSMTGLTALDYLPQSQFDAVSYSEEMRSLGTFTHCDST